MIKFFISIAAFYLFMQLPSVAQVRLPQLVRDSMVLQRDVPIRIWGWAGKGEKITIRFNNRSYRTTASAEGRWTASLSPMAAGGPYTMNIDASNHLTLKEILIGDVWFCSGQSNMVHQMILHRERYAGDIATADYPMIRQFWIPTLTDLQSPAEDLPTGYWRSANPEDVLQFSVVAYFFARTIHNRYHIPIGLINASVGGPPIQAWISEEGLKEFPGISRTIEKNKDTAYVNSLNRAPPDNHSAHWPENDKGLAGTLPWYDVNYTPKDWRPVTVPGYWEDQGAKDLDGVVWYRREIEVPPAMAGTPAKIALGRIVDADVVYINGREVGHTTYEYPQRRYQLPVGILKAGKNVLVIRVTNNAGKGGFVPDKPYYLAAGKDTIDLKGTWEYKVGEAFAPGNNTGSEFSAQHSPTALYNAMAAPVTNYAIRGFLWYQGESNTVDPKEYASLLPALIRDWRNKWRQGDLPFLFVQLPNFMDVRYLPVESQWAATRDVQRKTLTVPNTGMAVTIDLGEWNDLHPDRKKEIGERLALWAQKLSYGDTSILVSGPLYRSAKVDGNKVIVSFTHTGSGLMTKDGEELSEFAIAGADRKFVWAKTKIEGDQVIVWNDAIAHPLYVRYAWADNPDDPNLCNKNGLPASPFETDLTQQDYQHMLQQLKISATRPGPSGNPNAPNAANTDEAKASPYTGLPDPLKLKNGKKVTDAITWWNQRRPEIVEDFDLEIYGRVPANLPSVRWEVISVTREMKGEFPVVIKKLAGHVDNTAYPQIKVAIQLELTTPADAKGPVPVMMEFSFIFPPGFAPPRDTSRNAPPGWQQQVLAKGWGYAVLIPTSYQADNGAGLTEGIIGLVNKGSARKPDDWGCLRAWAWGASRALDYMETDAAVDTKRVGIEGLSRYGKAAVVAMANEPRFAIGFIGSSGAGGTKILRRVFGEQVENLASSGEYHWFAGNFIKYAGPLTPNDLPVDAHELIALCAPRPVFISVGSPTVEGQWVDARGMFLAGVNAGPVYTLLGKKDLGTAEFPPQEKGLLDGEIAFRQHSGGHTTGPNWSWFLEFASRYFNGQTSTLKGLKDYYKDYFPMGVAVSPRALKSEEASLVIRNFNSLTPENAMKMGPIHPRENEYYWKDADSIVAFAQRNGMKVRGHTLCWHNQTPGWIFTDSVGREVSKEVLLQRLKDHITTVVGHYKGQVYAWDVVNEAISDKPGEFLRPTKWLRIIGEEYIGKAFQWAHAADPGALLFYNDYNEIDPVKREKIYRLIKKLQADGIPVHGLGLQAHWAITEPSAGQMDSTLQRFSSLGVPLQITELDVSVYPKEHERRERRPEDADAAFTSEREQLQLEKYKMAFELFRKYRGHISGITFWNISDRSSWLDNFPVAGRKDYPLLFDRDLKPKKVYWEVVGLAPPPF